MALATSSIKFPTGDIVGDAPMKSIHLKILPNFHGITFKDLNTFLFEFDVVCWGYDYISDAQKLKVFPR